MAPVDRGEEREGGKLWIGHEVFLQVSNEIIQGDSEVKCDNEQRVVEAGYVFNFKYWPETANIPKFYHP